MGSAYKRNSNAWVTSHRIFGEYLRAACAMGLPVRSGARGAIEAHLLWYCNPDNPSGEIRGGAIALALKRLAAARALRGAIVADLTYWPFRQLLTGSQAQQLDAPWSDEVVQLWALVRPPGAGPAGDASPSAGRGAHLHHRSLPSDE